MSVAEVALVTVTLRMTAVASGGTGPASVSRPRTVSTRGVFAGPFACAARMPTGGWGWRLGGPGGTGEGVPATTGLGTGPCANGWAWSPAAATKTPARVPALSTLQ